MLFHGLLVQLLLQIAMILWDHCLDSMPVYYVLAYRKLASSGLKFIDIFCIAQNEIMTE
jgi:hypothetical protein